MSDPTTAGRRWAIDANVAMQQGVRRMIAGCAEFAGDQLLIPHKVLELVPTRYRRLARTRAKRIVAFGATKGTVEAAAGRPPTEEAEALAASHTLAMARAFADWAAAETRRNDGLWALAPESEQGELVVEKMIQAGIARAEDASAEEDAVVAGQAIASGCRWIASNNLQVLGGIAFDRWLATERMRELALASADVPLVLRPDEAVNTILSRYHDHPEDRRLLSAIAWELIRPDEGSRIEGTQRVETLERFANALEAGGAPQSARSIRITLDETGREAQVTARLLERFGVEGRLQGCRGAERRQVEAERRALRSGGGQPMAVPVRPATHRPGTVRKR